MSEKSEKKAEEPLSDLISFITNLLKRNYVVELEGVEIRANKMIISRERGRQSGGT